MTVCLILSTLGVMIFGYFIMRKIDGFLDRGGFSGSAYAASPAGGVLVLGSHAEAQKLRGAGIHCTEAETLSSVPAQAHYSVLFALGDSDEQNLETCRAIKRTAGTYVVARCCDAALLDVYRELGADRVLLGQETLDGVLAELWESRR